jgi:predicted DNA-binding ribbon-helix-helix protein
MATASKDKSLTSLKLEPQMFEDFKVMCVRTKFSLSKLVDRAMHYYINNEDFRKTMHSYKHESTGSAN